MNRRLLALLVAPAIVMASTGVSYGVSSYATRFKNTYPSSPLSSLSTQSGQAGNLCTVCHGPSTTPLNAYGNDFLSNGDSYAGLDSIDSDGDGFTNLVEINAGTFPGNASSKPSTGDTTAPTVTAFSMAATATSLTVAISSFIATDSTGVTGYMVTESATKPGATTAGWSATAPASYTFGGAGVKTAYGWAKDAAGNVSNSLNDTVTITLPDTTAPSVTAFTVPATATSLTVLITAFTATDSVGVTGYMVTESATKPVATATGWSATAPASYTFGGAGVKTAYGWAKDAAGNVSNSLNDTVTITLPDTIAPSVTGFSVPATGTSLAVAITAFTATDNVGVTGYLVTESATKPAASAAGWGATAPTNYTCSGAGLKTLYGWAKDAAGNVSAGMSASVSITLPDTTGPTVTAFSVPATAASLTVSITSFSATDSVGVAGYLVSESATKPAATAAGWSVTAPTSYTFSSAGTKTLYAWAKDAASNVSSSLSASVSITLPDTTGPTVTAFSLPGTAASLTVSITSFSATDSVGVAGYLASESATKPAATAAGWSATAPKSYTFSSAGTKTLYGWAKDAAGNVSMSLSATVTITLPVVDTIAPTVTAFSVPATATTLTVPISSLTATDNVGVTGYLVAENGTAPAATAAGWSVTAPKIYTFSSAGTKTLYGWAKDAAGNVSMSLSARVTITLPTADTTAPTVTAFSVPATATTLTVPISSLTATDNVGVTGYLVAETSATPAATATGWSSTAPRSYTFGSAGTKTLYGWAKDAAGNVSTSLVASVTITLPGGGDTTPPTIVSTSPARSARNVPANATISVTFSEAVLPASVIARTIRVVRVGHDDDHHGQTAVSGTVACNGKVVTFTPSRSLALGSYVVTVSGAKDVAGNTMVSSYRWTFSSGGSGSDD